MSVVNTFIFGNVFSKTKVNGRSPYAEVCCKFQEVRILRVWIQQ